MKEKFHVIEVKGVTHQKFNEVFGFRGHESKESVVQALMECFDKDVVDTDSIEIVSIKEVTEEEMKEILVSLNNEEEPTRTLQ